VIKRVRFGTRKAELAPEAFPAAWRQAASASADGPQDVRPLRVAVCTSLPEIISNPRHDGILLEWFSDLDHLERLQAWLETTGREPEVRRLHRALDWEASPVIVVDEVVLRGGVWLEQRWQEGGEKLKHMAIARRAADLTLAEFSERWKGRAGMIGRPGEAGTITIPDEARGRAYIQNHPQARRTGDWAYDAFNEVYFEDVDSLRLRVDWFKESLAGGTEDDLVRANWFLAAREEVLFNCG
jgi:hypothetical protein